MNITLELIQVLDEIDRNGSFEAAAQKLFKVRSALTYIISKYEKRLGIQIFDRSEYRATLTPAGRALLNQGRQLLNLSQQIEQNVKQSATGWETSLRIAYDEIINVDPMFELIKRFQKECPFPSINLEIYSEILGGCADALLQNKVDIAIGLTSPLPNLSECVFEPLGKNKFVFVVGADHPLVNNNKIISITELKKYPVIVARDSAKQIPQRTSMILSEQSRITFTSLDMKKRAQIFGLGIGFLPYNLIKEEIKEGRLIIKKVERQQTSTYCYIAWNKSNQGKGQKWFVKQLTQPVFKKKLLK